MRWKIDDIEIKNRMALAPMAGISNAAYIKICEELGLGYAVTELISAEAIVRNNNKTLDMLKGIDELKIPVGVQIFGGSVESMKKAALILDEKFNIKFIDINMGCPVPKVALRSQAGAALLKNPEKIYEMVKAIVDSVTCPVTVKIRSGWDANTINAVEVAKVCEKAGASAICVHGRTRSQGYSGKADLDVIKAVKEAVAIPVIGNGDVKDGKSAQNMLDYTGVDAVMIGRASYGNPWIFKEINEYLNGNFDSVKVTYQDRIEMCKKHMNYLKKIKAEKLVVLEMRSHIAAYLKAMPKANEIKNSIYQKNNINGIMQVLNDYSKSLESGE